MSEDSKELYRRFVGAWDASHVDAIGGLVTRDVIDHDAMPGTAPGFDGLVQLNTMLKTAFPDRSTDVHHVIAEGDKVAAVQTIRATNTGEFMGMAPTGKSFEVFSIHIVRVAGGKIAEHWGLLDQGGLMMQLGVMPMPPGTESWRPPPTSPQATSGGSGDPDRNRRALDEMIAAMRIGKMDDVLALVHEEDVDHAALPGQAPGKEGTRWRFEQLFSGLTEPDFRTLASVGEGPFLSQAYTFTATHTGPMMGMPPTNKSFTVSAIDFVLFEDGKFLEHWGLIDVPAMMAQLG